MSLENFVGGEGFDEVVVQVAAVRTLLHVAVLGEILHPHSDVHHRLAAVLAVEASLGDTRDEEKSHNHLNGFHLQTHSSHQQVRTAPQSLC